MGMGPLYMTSAQKGEVRVKKCPKFAGKKYINFVSKGEKGSNNSNILQLKLLHNPMDNKQLQGDT